jgi:RNA polymerase sigma-70 factor (family 1)
MGKKKSIENEVSFFSEWHEGKSSAIQQLFDHYYELLCKYAYRIVEDRYLSEDIAADSFDKIWRHRNRFDNLNSLLAYLYTITKNASLHQIAFLKKRKVAHQQIAYLADHQEEVTQSKMIRRELLKSILKESEMLSPKVKEVFALIYLDGMTPPQAAAKLGVSLNTVKTQQAVALRKLRRILKKKFSGLADIESQSDKYEEPEFKYSLRDEVMSEWDYPGDVVCGWNCAMGRKRVDAKRGLLISESFICNMRILLVSKVAC